VIYALVIYSPVIYSPVLDAAFLYVPLPNAVLFAPPVPKHPNHKADR
jgi:hypothetical protein